ncbi:MAG: hypothetical protein LQ346_000563 [Caloplaca aetnensis]|nr:MAG: hypothetical protein LQ346_000563 [Caloplaca aetnensis]
MPEVAPPADTKATIARSKSRYKGARPKPQRSISTPSVPAVPPIEPSPADPADKGRTRPNTTFDECRNASATTDEDEPLITLIHGRKCVQLPQLQTSGREALDDSGPTYKSVELHKGSSEKRKHGAGPTQFGAGDPHHDRHQELPQALAHGSRNTRPERRIGGRDLSPPKREQHHMVAPIRPSIVPKKSFTQRIAGLVNPPQSAAEAKAQLKQMISHPIAIEDGIPPPPEQFDAPKSAVNAGERTVRVKYREFQVPVSVLTSTTPADVIRSVSEKVVAPIDEESSVVLESFKQLGLERPLRRYEHIRDVLNSWDSDAQNTLIVEPSTTGGYEDELHVKNVPRKQSGVSSFHLYHSQRPGHWDKREVTLRSDGQMLIAKTSGAETSNICHLSDFDIYIPTAKQAAKKIRPPKRICFAIKSQQKSSMFMSTANFVHFFSSNDRKTAKALYTAVQEWRSWYLVNMMGKGAERPSRSIGAPEQPMADLDRDQSLANSRQRFQAPHKVHNSQQAPLKTSLQPGDLRPKRQEQDSGLPVPQTTRTRSRPKELGEKQATLVAASQFSSTAIPVGNPSTHSGLLGRASTERQRARRARETGPAMTSTQQPASSPTLVKSPTNELKRSSSQLKKPRPLIDLTPQYQEPPQHLRKGKGVTPGQIPAGGLVDIATSPEVAIDIPPTASWRRPATSSGREFSPPRNRSQS